MKIQCGQFEKVGYQHFENAMLETGQKCNRFMQGVCETAVWEVQGNKKRGVIVDSLSELLKEDSNQNLGIAIALEVRMFTEKYKKDCFYCLGDILMT